MVAHWQSPHKRIRPFDFASIITRFANNLWLMHNYPHYLTTPRTMLTIEYFVQAHMLANGLNNFVVMIYHGHAARIPLPCEDLQLYRVHQLTINLDQVAGCRSFAGTRTSRRLTCNMTRNAQYEQGSTSRGVDDDQEETSSAMQISGCHQHVPKAHDFPSCPHERGNIVAISET